MSQKKMFRVDLTGVDKYTGKSARVEDLQANIKKTFRRIDHDGEWFVSVSYSVLSLHELKDEKWNKETRKYEYDENAAEKKAIDRHLSPWHCHLIVYAEQDGVGLVDKIKETWLKVCKESGSYVRASKEGQYSTACTDSGFVIYCYWQERFSDYFPVNNKGVTRKKIIRKAKELFPKPIPSGKIMPWRYAIGQGLAQLSGAQYLINLTYWDGNAHAQKQNKEVENLWSLLRIKRDMETMTDFFAKIRKNLRQEDLRGLMGKYHDSTWEELDLESKKYY